VVDSVFTVADVARVLRSVEGRYALSARGIRYYARTGMVAPTGRLKPGKAARATRLYTVVDVALLRLVCRLHRLRAHERAIWGLLIYREAELRRVLAAGTGTIAVETPAALAITSEDVAVPKPIRIEVASLMSGLPERLAAYRRRRPKLWTGLAWVDAAEAAAQVAT
jgi:hypothetical protein